MNTLKFALLPLFAFTPIAMAQTIPAIPAPAAARTDEAPLELSVFEVRADKDTGYAASTALTGTRTSEKLANLPNSISVLTADFLSDIAAIDFFDAAEFGVSTENVANDSGTRGAPTGNRSGVQLSFRGLPAVRQLRDGFPWFVPLDIFNTERIEFNRGPGGLAYGDVDAGGIVNVTTKRASFRRQATAQIRYDDWGTQRFSFDVNQPLISNRVALRLNAISSERESWRQRGGSLLSGYAAALRWQPVRHTTVDATVEWARQSDGLTHAALTDMSRAYVRGTGSNALDANPSLAGTQTNGVGMQRTAAPGNTQVWTLIGGQIYNLESTATAVFRNSFINQGAAATVATGADPQNPARIPYLPTPESIVPRGQDWGGPGNFVEQKWLAYTVELKHDISDRFHLLFAHNGQKDKTQRVKSMNDQLQNNAGFGGRSLFIDVNPNLPNAAGTGLIPNPRYEQYYVHHHVLLNDDAHDVLNFRGLAVYDLALPWGISQRLVGSAGYRVEQYRSDVYAESLSREEIARRGLTGKDAQYANNFFYRYHYLADGNGEAALSDQPVAGVTAFTRQNVLGNNARFDQSLTSASVNAVGSYFKQRLYTSVGLGRDVWHQKSANIGGDPVTGERVFLDRGGSPIPEGGDIPVFENSRQWVTNQTYGAVWHVFPWLSLNGGYFESAQFTDNIGNLLDGSPLPPLTGEGHDYGIRLRPWGDRVTLALTRFKTIAENDSKQVSAGTRDELAPLVAVPFVNLFDTRDNKATGYEAEMFVNVGRNWTARLAYSENEVIFTNFYPLLRGKLNEARATARARGLDPNTATAVTVDFLQTQEEDATATGRKTANATLRYSFTTGALKGLSLGLASRFQQLADYRGEISIAGQVVIPATKGRDLYVFSPFAVYRHKFGKFTWTGQINVNNAFDRVVELNPSYRFTRYSDPRQIIFTSGFSF